MREIHEQYFDGSGDYSAKQQAKIKERLDSAFLILSWMQQPPRFCDPKESFKQYEKEVRIGKKQVREIAEDIFCSLTGEEVKTTKKSIRRNG